MVTLFIIIAAISLMLVLGTLLGIFKPETKTIFSAPKKAIQKKASWRDNVTTLLKQSNTHMTVNEFIIVNVLIGGALGVAVFLATGGILPALSIMGVACAGYYVYLSEKRTKLMIVYEKEQPQVLQQLISYFRAVGQNLQGAIEDISLHGPEIVRDDWKVLLSAFSLREPDVRRINQLITYRNSNALSRIIESIRLYRDKDLSRLPSTWQDIRKVTIAEIDIAQDNRSKLVELRQQLLLITGMPIFLSLFMILLTPSFRDFYSSPLGQVIIMLCWGITVLAYVLINAYVTKLVNIQPYVMTFPEARDADSFRTAASPVEPRQSVATPVPAPVNKPVAVEVKVEVKAPVPEEKPQEPEKRTSSNNFDWFSK